MFPQMRQGLSDFQLLIVTVLKGGDIKRGPRIIKYSDYSKFNVIYFRTDFKTAITMRNEQLQSYGTCDSLVNKV